MKEVLKMLSSMEGVKVESFVMKTGKAGYFVTCNSWEIAAQITSDFKRKKSLHIDMQNYNTITMMICLKADYVENKQLESEIKSLIDLFWVSVQNGFSSEDAQTKVHSFAMSNGMEKAHDYIYKEE